MEQSASGSKKIIAIVGLLVIVAVIGIGVAATTGKKAATTESVNPSTSTTADAGSSSTASSPYRDGAYSATGSYLSPGGQQSIKISVTLKNGNITSTSAISAAIDADGTKYQGKFISGYKSLVVGKNIDSVSLSKVSGSSLTSGGFNSALNQIKSQAKS